MAASAGLAAIFAIMLVLRNAREVGLVQPPNHRSSHIAPTPTGGGLGIVLGGTIAGAFAAAHSPWPTLLVVVGGVIIAVLGLRDDLKPTPPLLRLVVEIVVLALVICFAMPFDRLPDVLGMPLPAAIVATLAVLVGVYWMNIFNFMDGIDGLAGSEALFLVAAAAGLAASSVMGIAADAQFWWLIGLASAIGVFVWFNWQPARIFMGDIGSLYLGFIIVILALMTVLAQWLTIWEWLILAASFFSDATVTLLRRAVRREDVFEAHRRHAYQALSRRFGSHQVVTASYFAINLIWLYPLAYYAHNHTEHAVLATMAAYVPLVALVYFAGAGRPQHDRLA